jgi:hypothetical protein
MRREREKNRMEMEKQQAKRRRGGEVAGWLLRPS